MFTGEGSDPREQDPKGWSPEQADVGEIRRIGVKQDECQGMDNYRGGRPMFFCTEEGKGPKGSRVCETRSQDWDEVPDDEDGRTPRGPKAASSGANDKVYSTSAAFVDVCMFVRESEGERGGVAQ